MGCEMRFLGLLEVSRGWRLDAVHVPRVLSDATDEFFRWDQSVIHANLARARPHILHIHGMCGSWRVNTRQNSVHLCVDLEFVRRAIDRARSPRVFAFWVSKTLVLLRRVFYKNIKYAS